MTMQCNCKVCELLRSSVSGITPSMVETYCSAIWSQNLNGRVLFNCNLEELKSVLNMNFGDWEIFRMFIATLRDREKSGRRQQATVKSTAPMTAALVEPVPSSSPMPPQPSKSSSKQQTSVERQVTFELTKEILSSLISFHPLGDTGGRHDIRFTVHVERRGARGHIDRGAHHGEEGGQHLAGQRRGRRQQLRGESVSLELVAATQARLVTMWKCSRKEKETDIVYLSHVNSAVSASTTGVTTGSFVSTASGSRSSIVNEATLEAGGGGGGWLSEEGRAVAGAVGGAAAWPSSSEKELTSVPTSPTYSPPPEQVGFCFLLNFTVAID